MRRRVPCEWARQRFGDDAAVVGAEIDLEDCIDLLDIPWERVIVRRSRGISGTLDANPASLSRGKRAARTGWTAA